VRKYLKSESMVLKCAKCLTHGLQMEGVNQRNTRLQRESANFEEKTKTLTLCNNDLNIQMAELKRHDNIMACLRMVQNFVPSVKERKIAVEARTLCQTLTVALLDKERSLPMAAGGPAEMSPIAARKSELEADALARGSTLEQEAKRFRSNKYADIMQAAAASTDEDQKSIFEQLDVLTGQVTGLVARHETHAIRRRRKEQDAKDAAALPIGTMKKQHSLFVALKNADSMMLGEAVAQHSLPPRPQTAHS